MMSTSMLSLVLLVEHNWMIIVYTVVSISLHHQDMGEYLLCLSCVWMVFGDCSWMGCDGPLIDVAVTEL